MAPPRTIPRVTAAPAWRRIAAGAFDLGLVCAISAATSYAYLQAVHATFPDRYWNYFDYVVDLVDARPDLVLPPLIAFLAVYVTWGTLWPLLLGGTPAATAAGLVVSTSSGARPGAPRLFIRSVLSLALALAAGIGPAWSLVDARRRMLHDILTGCQVLAGGAPRAEDRSGFVPDVRAVKDGGYGDGPRR